MSEDVVYRASTWQQNYHDCDVDELLGAGSAGPGKTECLIHEPLVQVMIEQARVARRPELVAEKGTKLYELIGDHPLKAGESKGWWLFLRRTSPRLLPVIKRMTMVYPKVDPGVQWRAQDMMWTFSSGYRIQCGHCVNRDDWMQYQGIEVTGIAFDELVEFEEAQYDQIRTRLRTTDPVLIHFLKVRAMSNPVQQQSSTENFVLSDPFWVRKRFVDPAPQGNMRIVNKVYVDGVEERVTRMYMPATLDDNPNALIRRQYKKHLLSFKHHIRKALLDGDWYVTKGSYFGDVWDPAHHICAKFKIPPDWDQVRAMDWGFKHPGCVLWGAIDPEGTLYIHREYDFQGLDAMEVAKNIRDIEKEMGLWSMAKKRSRITGPADTQLWEERGDKGKSKAAEMAAIGVHWTQANKRSRGRNGQRVYERLMAHERDTRQGGLVIFETCTPLIRVLPAIQTDPADRSGETPAKSNIDDPYDALAYLCEYCSNDRPIRVIPEDDEKDWDEDEDEAESGGLGRDGYGGY